MMLSNVIATTGMLNSLPALAPAGVDFAASSAAPGLAAWAWLLILIPLLSAGFLLVIGKRADTWGHWLGVAASSLACVLGIVILVQMLGVPGGQRAWSVGLYTFISGYTMPDISFGLLLDPLSLTFVILVTLVGSLIHLYAVSYMEHDVARRRFFAYLNLFIAAMLTLVLADSYLLLFFGWEGVGLASYLLIGFWNQVPEYATAANKAFIMNRVGDMGLLLAMAAMLAATGHVNFTGVFGAVGQMPAWAPTLIGVFLLVAACGKSAQFPLQAWLGDAMAGPTPVSALIHAATMVTAGVYLVVRSGPIYAAAPGAQLAVAIVGIITLVFGAIVGAAKDDIKKVLAASTMSQIGYMMLAAGLGPLGGAYAIFHLLNHGFFKAQMFLGAGSVMHAMGDQVNMRRFGALRNSMKITWLTFGVGWLAILGVPPFAGFFSKDKIIEVAFMPGPGDTWQPWVFGFIAMAGAGLTSFYMSRLFFMTFHGQARWTTEAEGAPVHPHESPKLMTVPLLVLSVFSIGLGLVLSINGMFVEWLSPVVGTALHTEPVIPALAITGITLALVVVGIGLAYTMYVRSAVPVAVPTGNAIVYAARRDLYQDKINESLFMMPGNLLKRGLTWADHNIVDGIVRGIAYLFKKGGQLAALGQNGYVRAYATYILAGTVAVLVIVMVGRI